MKESKILIEAINRNNLWEKELVFNRSGFIKRKGSIDANLYFVVNGSVRIFVIEEHEEHTLRFGYKDNLIVSLDSFITGKPSDIYIQTLKKTTIKSLSKTKFTQLIKDENLQSIWIKTLEYLILQQLERERDILTTSPIDSYKRVLKRNPKLFQEIPNKYIADYLRMTPETLSRIKKS